MPRSHRRVGGALALAMPRRRLKARLDAELLATFEVGVRYQMYHAFALLAVGWAQTRWPGPVLNASGWLFVAGTVIFSGSLYVLSLSGQRWLGAIAPDRRSSRCWRAGCAWRGRVWKG